MNIVITGIVLFYGWPLWTLTLISLVLLGATFYAISRYQGTRLERMTVTVHSFRGTRSEPPVVQPQPEAALEG